MVITDDLGTTQVLNGYIFDPEPLPDTTTTVPFGKTPMYADLPPGGSYFTTFYLEDAFGTFGPAWNATRTPKPGHYKLRVVFYPHQFEPHLTNWKDSNGYDKSLCGNEADFTVAASDDIVSEFNHRLSWWEETTLTLLGGHRFTYSFFSDAGGLQNPIKGSYTETSETLVLRPVVNRRNWSLRHQYTWKKTRADAGEPCLEPLPSADRLTISSRPRFQLKQVSGKPFW